VSASSEPMYPLQDLSDDEWLKLRHFEHAQRPAEVTELDIAAVHRVHTDRGSHIEPPLNDDWTGLEKLRWLTAVVLGDAKLPRDTITIDVGRSTIDGIPQEAYEVHWLRSSTVIDYHYCWTWLTGIGDGIELARATAPED
jgi:hypothetical protein